jgi:hemerythrin-like domain-containing protein
MDTATFSNLSETHLELREVMHRHQAALLAGDLPLALQRFLDLADDLDLHIQEEDERLVPLYRDRVQPSLGGDWRNFTGEHEKVRLFLNRIRQKMETLPNAPDRARAVISLLDEEARFKDLLEHHYKREEMFLFPELDRVASEDEKHALLAGNLTLHYL